MRRNGGGEPASGDSEPIGLLLAQLGAHGAKLFAQRVQSLDLTPALVGLLRRVDARPARSQSAVADELGIPAARLVPLVDALEQRGLLERRRNRADRRQVELHLSARGHDLVHSALAVVVAEHDDAITSGLSAGERELLNGLLARMIEAQRLTPGVHPGYRALAVPPITSIGAR